MKKHYVKIDKDYEKPSECDEKKKKKNIHTEYAHSALLGGSMRG